MEDSKKNVVSVQHGEFELFLPKLVIYVFSHFF